MSLLLTKSELKELCDTYNLTVYKLREGQYASSIECEQHLMFEHPLLSSRKNIILRFHETYNGCFRVLSFHDSLLITPFDKFVIGNMPTSVYTFTELKFKINVLMKNIHETYIKRKVNKKLFELEKDF